MTPLGRPKYCLSLFLLISLSSFFGSASSFELLFQRIHSGALSPTSHKIQRRTLSVPSDLASVEDVELGGESTPPPSPDTSKKKRVFIPPIWTTRFMNSINISPPPSGQASSIRLPTVTRSESRAYPRQDTRGMLSKMQYYLRQHTRAVGLVIAVATFVVVLTSDFVYDHIPVRSSGVSLLRGGVDSASYSFAGAQHPGYFRVDHSIIHEDDRVSGYHFGMVTDLDTLSRIPGSKKPMFQSHLVAGKLIVKSKNKYEITFDDSPIRHLVTGHNEAGRGAEFSELTVFDNRLITVDDRTGDIFEILNSPTGQDSYVVPRMVITEGDGDTDKGMKWEWSTVKGDELYLGSMGKEFTNPAGEIVNVNNLWIAVVNKRGEFRRENWMNVYDVVRRALGAESPGYMVIESVNWSEHLKKWVFLPRRISQGQAYNDVLDEKRGGQQLVLVDETFTKTQVIDLKLDSKDPLKGFSSFSFVPNTQDRHILAIRSVEEDCALDDESLCKQRSYVVVLDILTGESLAPEVKYEHDWKFEGIEFFNPYDVPSFS